MFKKYVGLCLIAVALGACAKPPAKEEVKAAIGKFVPVNFEVLQMSELKDAAGLYEVVISVNRHPVVLYVDRKCNYVFSGSLMSTKTKANLTVERQKEFQNK